MIHVFSCLKDSLSDISIRRFNIKHRNNDTIIGFEVSSSLGSVKLYFTLPNCKFRKNLFLKCKLLSALVKYTDLTISGLCFGYFRRFKIIGYNYRIKASFYFDYLTFFVGHFYSVVIKLPINVRVFKKKRGFIIFGFDLLMFNFVVDFIRHIRDHYPYKNRGFLITNEFVKLKKGKKIKFK